MRRKAHPATLCTDRHGFTLHLVLKRRRPRAIARRTCPRTLCELLFLLQAADVSQRSPDHGAALSRGAQALVEALPCIAGRPPRDAFDGWPAYDERG